MYCLHIDAAEYSLCLNALGLYRDIVKTPSNRHYIFRHIFKLFFDITNQILRIQQISPLENV